MCLFLCAWECKCSQKPEVSDPSGVGVTDSYEPPDVGARIELGSSTKVICAINS